MCSSLALQLLLGSPWCVTGGGGECFCMCVSSSDSPLPLALLYFLTSSTPLCLSCSLPHSWQAEKSTSSSITQSPPPPSRTHRRRRGALWKSYSDLATLAEKVMALHPVLFFRLMRSTRVRLQQGLRSENACLMAGYCCRTWC